MKLLNLKVQTKGRIEPLEFQVKKMINGGFCGRDQEEVRKHIDELRRQGIKAPEKTPVFYPVIKDMVTCESEIEVVGESTSGEAEYVLILQGKNVYVAIGSDHTDRDLEKTDVLKSKQICSNVMSKEIWPLEEVEKDWDSIVLRSWVTVKGKKELFQEGKLQALMTPRELIGLIKGKVQGDLNGMVIYSGTIASLKGEMLPGDLFEAELFDPSLKRSLSCKYNVKPIRWLKG